MSRDGTHHVIVEKPASLRSVTTVALTQWLVYLIDNFAGPRGVASYPPVCFSRVGRSQTMARLSADSREEGADHEKVLSDSDEVD